MKAFKLIALLLFVSMSSYATEYMINGGFEYLDPNIQATADPDFSIRVAAPWRNLIGSCDVFNPGTNDYPGSTNAHSGVGCARLFHLVEYAVGQTLSLTAGQSYEVSFWVKHETNNGNQHDFGMYITADTNDFTNFNRNSPVVVPQVKLLVVSDQWVKISHCFTATQSGTHYLVFGSRGEPDANNYMQSYYIDDVSVKDRQAQPTDPVADINMANQVCVEGPINADGTASQNETNYQWELYSLNLAQDDETFVVGQTVQNGQAGVYDVMAALNGTPYPQMGMCFNLVLWTQNTCSAYDHQIFCIDDPRFVFISDGDPVCENTPVDLQVTGDDGWTYTWSTGQSGVGTKSVSVTPTAPTSSYTVTTTTPASCSYTQTLDLTVSSLASQVPPTMDGINGWGEYTYYVNAGSAVDFTSTISNNAGETVDGSFNNNNLPNGYSYIIPPNGTNGGTFSFHWQTQLNTTGDYSFSLYLKDNNGCLEMDNTYTFNIKVICEYCPICISYDDRTPTNNPVPADTKAGRCINVGLNSVVEIGTGNSAHLQAGESIEMGAFFDSNGGVYEAVIDTTTCLEACQSCCDNFSGFTVDTPFPNIFSPNGDGANDIWYVRDDDHQYCAFGATGFELYIQNKQDLTVYELVSYPGQGCCPFQALITNPSSIYWNGKYNVGPFKGQPVPDGVYYYVLYLHGCGQTGTYSGNISIYVNSSGMMQNDGSGTQSQTNTGLVVNDTGASRDSIRTSGSGLPEDHFYVFPNPTKNIIRLHSEKTIKQVQIFDANGKQVLILNSDFEQPIDLSSLGSGSYRVIAMFNDNSSKEQIIVKE